MQKGASIVLTTSLLNAVGTPGLSILTQANRTLAFTSTDARLALYVVLALVVAAVLAPQFGRLPLRAGAAVAGAVAVFAIAMASFRVSSPAL